MPTLRNVSPLGALEVPLLRAVVDGEFECSDEHARALLPQWQNFAPVDEAAKAIHAELFPDVTPPDETQTPDGEDNTEGESA